MTATELATWARDEHARTLAMADQAYETDGGWSHTYEYWRGQSDALAKVVMRVDVATCDQ